MGKEFLPLAVGIDTDAERAQIVAANGMHVCYVEVSPVMDTALSIVRACNSHDALVEALASCADYLAEFYEEGREHHVIKLADAALAAAKGES
ncbi:MAG: hypothetical protein WC120_05280 [Parcubacteria group bacterium]|jgi:hypothetical protein